MERLELGIDSLNLSIRTYNAVIRGIMNLSGKNDIDEITIGDLLSLDYNQIRNFRNLGNRSLAELLNKVHMFGLRFDFEYNPDINEDINPKTLKDCLFLQKIYLEKIKERQEQIDLIQKELEELRSNKLKVDEMILKLFEKDEEDVKKY